MNHSWVLKFLKRFDVDTKKGVKAAEQDLFCRLLNGHPQLQQYLAKLAKRPSKKNKNITNLDEHADGNESEDNDNSDHEEDPNNWMTVFALDENPDPTEFKKLRQKTMQHKERKNAEEIILQFKRSIGYAPAIEDSAKKDLPSTPRPDENTLTSERRLPEKLPWCAPFRPGDPESGVDYLKGTLLREFRSEIVDGHHHWFARYKHEDKEIERQERGGSRKKGRTESTQHRFTPGCDVSEHQAFIKALKFLWNEWAFWAKRLGKSCKYPEHVTNMIKNCADCKKNNCQVMERLKNTAPEASTPGLFGHCSKRVSVPTAIRPIFPPGQRLAFGVQFCMQMLYTCLNFCQSLVLRIFSCSVNLYRHSFDFCMLCQFYPPRCPPLPKGDPSKSVHALCILAFCMHFCSTGIPRA